MTDFVVFSLGCKVNQVEGQSLAGMLVQNGYSVAFDLVPSRCYILNTCSVTGEADRKSRQAVARVLKLNPAANVFVMGCSSQFDPSAFAHKPNVRFVSGTAGKEAVLSQIYDAIDQSDAACIQQIEQLPQGFERMSTPLFDRTRAYIKVQDGCNQFCSYCIVPHLRGRSRSRTLADILDEAQALTELSKEIVLTGINLSDYQIDGQNGLVRLVKSFQKFPVRKRLGSLGINIISDDLLAAMQDAGFCGHFHLSVQSGSDNVLARMNRNYTARDILQKVEKIRHFYPKSGIMSDIITGFGGETEAEHAETLATVQAARFSDAHIFPYSERRGTKAASMEQVDKSVRKRRAMELSTVVKSLKTEFLKQQIGTTLSVYVEQDGEGYSENYCKVYVDAQKGEICQVAIDKLYLDGLHGVRQL